MLSEVAKKSQLVIELLKSDIKRGGIIKHVPASTATRVASFALYGKRGSFAQDTASPRLFFIFLKMSSQ